MTEWGVSNFKALEYATLPLVNLDVILGPNSSGKSSLLQSLLLLAQSTEDEIILNGPLVRLGDPSDVIRRGNDGLTISYMARGKNASTDEVDDVLFEIILSKFGTTLAVSEFIAVDQVSGSVVIHATSERVPSSAKDSICDRRAHENLLRITLIDGERAPSSTFIVFSGFIPTAIAFRRTRKDILTVLKRSARNREDLYQSERAFDTFFHILEWLSQSKASVPEKFAQLLPSRAVSSALEGMLNLPSSEMRELLECFVNANFKDVDWVRAQTYGYQDPYSPAARIFPPLGSRHRRAASVLSFGAEALRTFQGSIRYLGPLREEPQVVSPTGARYRALPAGIKGEYTADLLARSKDQVVKYHDWNNRSKTEPLPLALTRWVAHLGLGDEVTVEDQGKLGRGLRMHVNGVERDLTTIGVGASQLLPVLAVILTASSGNVILLEQPELHLHPLVQSRLADFLLYARADVKLVVESHSEYLVTRIRRRVVENPGLLDRVAVLFAEQHKGVTELRRLYLDRLGNFSDWPIGFFDTQDSEAAELAQAVRNVLCAENGG
ncbi:DUF3696 domain-containing protein [Mycolicibacterium insubricum]|nr:DUF3696 domain-containing protein [Mycolicibacterium insubricum]